MPDPIPAAYADCIDIRCRRCKAEPGDYCTNKINRRHRGTPCLIRISDAESEAR
ncbi:hypothetical protein IU421_14905 [Nocardia cyriacigeorgica]|uniref:hypothetical protein n=1 Tax=Nocardia cyriacigeorgica TaxID=135487 RepID=UPI00189442C5|nr:hypothetical protein [Nocardia cyriacigeorgica]MBF6515560.1 hypothetical protein [Nocardia cyriacigeorgica]